MAGEVIIKEAMKTNPAVIKPTDFVIDAVKIMKKRKIGNVIVIENKQPIGILTESDIIRKVVAEGKNAKKTIIKEVMSSPVIVIEPYLTLNKAMNVMTKCNLRRLPVIENDELIGIITEKDIFRISPILREISKEWYDITLRDEAFYKKQIFSGKCEDCGILSTNLKNVEGRLLCDDCIDEMKYNQQ